MFEWEYFIVFDEDYYGGDYVSAFFNKQDAETFMQKITNEKDVQIANFKITVNKLGCVYLGLTEDYYGGEKCLYSSEDNAKSFGIDSDLDFTIKKLHLDTRDVVKLYWVFSQIQTPVPKFIKYKIVYDLLI